MQGERASTEREVCVGQKRDEVKHEATTDELVLALQALKHQVPPTLYPSLMTNPSLAYMIEVSHPGFPIYEFQRNHFTSDVSLKMYVRPISPKRLRLGQNLPFHDYCMGAAKLWFAFDASALPAAIADGLM